MPTNAAPIATIKRPVAHGRNPAQRPNAYPQTNNIAIATALEKRSANRASPIRMNGMTIGKVDTKLSKQMPAAPSPSRFVSRGRSGSGNCDQSLPHQFQLGWRQDRRQQGRQRVRDDAMCAADIGGLAYRTQLHGVAPPLVEASHQKHGGVDDSPSQVAAEGGEEHGPNLDAVRRYDAERQGEGQRHDQAEQDFRDPVHRFEDSIGRFGRKRRQRIHCRCDWLVFHLCLTDLDALASGRREFSLAASPTARSAAGLPD